VPKKPRWNQPPSQRPILILARGPTLKKLIPRCQRRRRENVGAVVKQRIRWRTIISLRAGRQAPHSAMRAILSRRPQRHRKGNAPVAVAVQGPRRHQRPEIPRPPILLALGCSRPKQHRAPVRPDQQPSTRLPIGHSRKTATPTNVRRLIHKCRERERDSALPLRDMVRRRAVKRMKIVLIDKECDE
jgi:hypothetical protein